MLDQLLDPKLTETRTPAIGYIRVSMAREEMISPDLQRESIERWAKHTRHRIVDWVIDLDKTGRNFKRRIMKAIERVEKGEARVIAVWKYSRFGRTRPGIEANLARIERVGGQLVSATEDVDATTATGWFQRDMIFSVATFESKRAGEQWDEARDWRRRNGLPASGMRRWGYVWHPRRLFDPDGSIHLQEERYEPDPDTGPVLAGLYSRFIDGESLRSLAFWLNEHGYRTVRGNPWTVASVARCLDSGFAAGYLRIHDGCTTPDCVGSCQNYVLVKHPTKHHPPLIAEATWRRYSEVRAATRILPPRTRSAGYPFTGLLKCGLCGSTCKHIRYASGGNRYVCRLYSESGPTACTGVNISSSDANAAILAFLDHTLADAVSRSADQQEIPVGGAADRPTPEQERERIEKQIAQLDKAIGKAMRSHALSDKEDPDGVLEAEYQALLGSLREEKGGLAKTLKALSADALDTAQARHDTSVRVAIGLVEEWNTLPPGRVNSLLRHLVESATVRPAGAGVDIQPTWTEDLWSWDGPGLKRTKRERLAELWLARPDATGREIAAILGEEGASVTATYALAVKRELEASTGVLPRRSGVRATSGRYGRAAREENRRLAEEQFGRGGSNKTIAAALGVSVRTVERWRTAWEAGT